MQRDFLHAMATAPLEKPETARIAQQPETARIAQHDFLHAMATAALEKPGGGLPMFEDHFLHELVPGAEQTADATDLAFLAQDYDVDATAVNFWPEQSSGTSTPTKLSRSVTPKHMLMLRVKGVQKRKRKLQNRKLHSVLHGTRYEITCGLKAHMNNSMHDFDASSLHAQPNVQNAVSLCIWAVQNAVSLCISNGLPSASCDSSMEQKDSAFVQGILQKHYQHKSAEQISSFLRRESSEVTLYNETYDNEFRWSNERIIVSLLRHFVSTQ